MSESQAVNTGWPELFSFCHEDIKMRQKEIFKMGRYGEVIVVFGIALGLASGCGREEQPPEESPGVTAGEGRR